jgi:hypothetical protein
MWRTGIIIILLLGGAIGPASAHHKAGHKAGGSTGAALYPDLVTHRPFELYFDQVVFSDGSTHHVLRFSNTVENIGSGRLELQGEKQSKIYQNVYDAARGGNLVQQIYIGNDSIFHEGHDHYHIENFNSYLLLQKDASGVYQATTKEEIKSSCLLDFFRASGSYSAQYTSCLDPAGDETLQGLTVGWADTYWAELIDQWVDLGSSPLANGTYAIRSTADPLNMIAESNNENNHASTCFTVQHRTPTMDAAMPGYPSAPDRWGLGWFVSGTITIIPC